MKFVPVHHCSVKDLKLIIHNKENWQSWLKKMDGKRVRVTIDVEKDQRSLKQNSFYWMYLSLVENETGTPAEDVHEIAKRKFLRPRFVKFKNEEIKLPASTTRLDKLDFNKYMDKISEMTGVPIPNPDDVKL